MEDSFYTIKFNGEKIKKEIDLPNHEVAFKTLMDELIDNDVVKNYDEIKGIGHRIVQGGSYFDKTVVVDEEAAADDAASEPILVLTSARKL